MPLTRESFDWLSDQEHRWRVQGLSLCEAIKVLKIDDFTTDDIRLFLQKAVLEHILNHWTDAEVSRLPSNQRQRILIAKQGGIGYGRLPIMTTPTPS